MIENADNMTSATRQANAYSLLALMRPQQWLKNVFVLAPLLFSHSFVHLQLCLKTALAFVSFCLVSSAIYTLNDLCDIHEDRQHPTKKLRPIASGAVSSRAALVLAIVLTGSGLALAWYVDSRVAVTVLLYAVTHIAYSLALKRVAILDVMTIAAGFVLRILAGSFAISVAPSHWLVICTMMISLFLGFTKRRAELITIGSQTRNSRAVLKDYSTAFMDQAIAMTTGATIVCYTLYTVDERTVELFGTQAMIVTIPSVIYGLLRYVYIIYHLEKGEDPSHTLSHDIPMIANIIVWIVAAFLVVTYGSQLSLFR
jgi:4-hydroxybenzoate polyprenyltransferase